MGICEQDRQAPAHGRGRVDPVLLVELHLRPGSAGSKSSPYFSVASCTSGARRACLACMILALIVCRRVNGCSSPADHHRDQEDADARFGMRWVISPSSEWIRFVKAMTRSDQKMKLANDPSQVVDGASVRVFRLRSSRYRLTVSSGTAWSPSSCLRSRTLTGPWYRTYEWVTGAVEFQLLADGPERQVVQERVVDLLLLVGVGRPLGGEPDVLDVVAGLALGLDVVHGQDGGEVLDHDPGVLDRLAVLADVPVAAVLVADVCGHLQGPRAPGSRPPRAGRTSCTTRPRSACSAGPSIW